MTETASCSRPLAAVDSGNHGSVYTAVVPVSNVPKAASAGLISNKTIKKLHHTVDCYRTAILNITSWRILQAQRIRHRYQYGVSWGMDTAYRLPVQDLTEKKTTTLVKYLRSGNFKVLESQNFRRRSTSNSCYISHG
ncbi:hypothetical protein Tco_0843156 [Tanacetum coccineum]|uniref:Uncharacterized protein n=1 Tax=Tanacetum coccineum TaxID=301880 RepID=A0ABQ5B714_9ASTR